MSKITLRKALNDKNRLKGELARIDKRIKDNNQFREGTTPDYDINKLVDERLALMNKLIALKTAIAKANVAIYEKINRVAELKGYIALLNDIPAVPESDVEYHPTLGRQMKLKNVVLNQVLIDNHVKQYELEITALNDAIDYFNGTTEIEIAL